MPPENNTTASTIFRFDRISIEARKAPDWAKSVSPAEAERAWRFASHELNGFPEWLPKLYAEHKPLIAELMMREVKYELASETEQGMHYIIDDLSLGRDNGLAGAWSCDFRCAERERTPQR